MGRRASPGGRTRPMLHFHSLSRQSEYHLCQIVSNSDPFRFQFRPQTAMFACRPRGSSTVRYRTVWSYGRRREGDLWVECWSVVAAGLTSRARWIARYEHFQIGDLVPGENLIGRLKVTEMGRRFVNLKEGRGLNVS